MDYELSKHAEHVLDKRGIPLDWVEQVLEQPASTQQDRRNLQLEHRLGTIAEYGNRVMRVIVNTKVCPQKIIAVYFDRKMKDKL